MANRICFISTPDQQVLVKELEVEFEYFSGFSLTQKRKCIESLHSKIHQLYPHLAVVEVSTKSPLSIGRQLSAFNLQLYDCILDQTFPVENLFQSSKVFEQGGPYRDLLHIDPSKSRTDSRLKTSGKLMGFDYNGVFWETEPMTAFYDWLYITALDRNQGLAKEILRFDAFTDIEFNHKKSINCQARAAAMFVSLEKIGTAKEIMAHKEEFVTLYKQV